MSTFEMKYDFKARQRHDRRITSRENRRLSVKPSKAAAEFVEMYKERTRLRKACEHDVLKSHGGILPSSKNPILKLLVSKTHKSRNGLLTGMDKAIVSSVFSKLLGLEDLYVVANSDMRGFYRIDVDGLFEDDEHLLSSLRACDAPIPNIVSWIPNHSGNIKNPHLIYLLRDSVCFSGKGSQRAKQLYHAVERGLYAKLLPLGADPGGMSNGLRFKNPLSPHAAAIWPNEIAYQLSSKHKKARAGLLALGDLVPTDVPENQVWESRAEALASNLRTAEGAASPSNLLFHELREIASQAVKRSRTAKGDVGTEDDLLRVLTDHISATYALPHKGPIRIAQSVARWFWENHDPLRAGKDARRPNRGLLKGALKGLDLKARQKAGQANVAERRAKASETQVSAAIKALSAGGGKITIAAVASHTELAEKTVRSAMKRIAKNNQKSFENIATAASQAPNKKAVTWCMIKRKALIKGNPYGLVIVDKQLSPLVDKEIVSDFLAFTNELVGEIEEEDWDFNIQVIQNQPESHQERFSAADEANPSNPLSTTPLAVVGTPATAKVVVETVRDHLEQSTVYFDEYPLKPAAPHPVSQLTGKQRRLVMLEWAIDGRTVEYERLVWAEQMNWVDIDRWASGSNSLHYKKLLKTKRQRLNGYAKEWLEARIQTGVLKPVVKSWRYR